MRLSGRRNFVKKSLAYGAGFFIVPRSVLGGKGYTPPSDMLNIGAIGIGGKGRDIMGDWVKNERVISLCDIDPDDIFKNGVSKS